MFEAEKIDAIPVAQAQVRVDEKPSPLITALILALGDYLAVYMSYAAAVAIRDLFQGELSRQLYFSLWPLLLLFPVSYYFSGLYQFGVALPEEWRRLTYTTLINFCILGAVTFLYKVGVLYSRGVFVIALGLALLFVPLGRLIIRALFARQPWWGTGVIILGAAKTGEMIVKNLLAQRELGLKPIALLDDDPSKHGKEIEGILVTGPLNLAGEYARQGIRYAIVAMPGLNRPKLFHLIQKFASLFHHLILVPDLFGFSTLWVQTREFGNILGLEVRQQLVMPIPIFMKRMIDWGIIIFLLPLLIVLGVLISIGIKLDSPGPVFYKQRRVGKDGKIFVAWKFRSMIHNADAKLQEYLEKDGNFRSEWESKQKIKVDPRITRFGKFLRRTSLDELPQFWNVLRGEMSVVGPRPCMESQINLYGEIFNLYKQVRPGITGLWQVSGRNETTYAERVAMDAYYVRNWSPWLDLVILVKTVWVVLTGKGAY